MSLNDSHIRQLLAAKKTRRMRNYPEGSNLAWSVIEDTILAAVFLVWFFAYVTIRIIWF